MMSFSILETQNCFTAGVPKDLLGSVLERGAKNGPRNAITGTYRISLHKGNILFPYFHTFP